jgi:hypothetical protein
MKEFPEKIYVKKEQDGDCEYLIAGEQPADISESEDTTIAGEYRLVRIVSLVNKTEIVEDE